MNDEGERFLQQALELDLLDPEQVEHCRLVDGILRDFGHEKRVDEIVIRRQYLRRKQVALVWKSLDEKRVGRYDVLEKIGAGGFGKVYRARDTKLDRVVALKVLAREYSEDASVRDTFLREARVSMQLNHVNIVRGLDFGEASGYSYLAMEFVPGETLAEKLEREQTVGEREAFDIVRQAVSALEYVQSYQLVHRDIKPSNLILTPDGQAKVLDLGLTRPTLHEAKEVGIESQARGTAMYTSPEQIKRPDNIDWRADQYSLGATLYHMLTGRPPFRGESARDIMDQQINAAPQDPRDFVLELSNGAATVVLKMLHKDPLLRYASLDALREDAEAVCEGRVPTHTLSVAPVTATTSTKSPGGAKTDTASGTGRPLHAHRPTRRRREKGPPLGLIAVVAVVLVAGVVFAIKGGGDGDDGPGGEGPAGGDDTASTGAGDSAGDGGDGALPDTSPSPSREALAQAKRHRKDNPDDFAGIGERLRIVVDGYAGTPAAREAAALLETVAGELEKAAELEKERRLALARTAQGEGRLADAWDALDAFPAAYGDSAAAGEVGREAKRIEAAAVRAVTDALAEARRATAEHHFGDAEKALGAADLARIPVTREDITAARAEIAKKRAGYQRARAAQRDDFDLLYARALLAAGGGDLPAARALLSARRDDLDAFAPEVTTLENELVAVERIHAAVLAQWRAMEGEDVELRTPRGERAGVSGKAGGVDGNRIVVVAGGRKVQVEIVHVAAADAFGIASVSRDPMSRPSPDAELPFALACADLGHARKLLADAKGRAGHDVRTARVNAVADYLEGQVDQLLELAERSRRGGSARSERDALERAVQLLPTHPGARVALARRLVDDGDLDGAAACIEVVADRTDAPAELHLVHAGICAKRKNLEGERAATTRFLELADDEDPEYAAAEKRLAEITAKLNAASAKSLRKQADRDFRRKQWAPAAAAYRSVLALDPDDAEAQLRLGLACFEQNQVFPAFKWLSVFVREHPRDRKVKDAKKALAKLETYRRSRKEDKDTAQAARKALDAGKAADAVAGFEKALVWSPFLDDARLGLARAHLLLGRADNGSRSLHAAVEAADDLLIVSPGHPGAYLIRAQALHALDRGDAALAAAMELTKADEKSAAGCLIAGEVHLAADRLDEARDQFAEAYLRDASAAALYGTGRVSEKQGRYTEAAEFYRRALQRHVVTKTLKLDLEAAIRRAEAQNR